MKNIVKLSIVAVVILFFTACKNDKKETDLKEGHSNEMNMENEHDMNGSSTDMATVRKSDLTNQIVGSYLQLKNALVLDDEKNAAEAGKGLHKAFESFDMTQLNDAQHKEYMEIAENAKEHANHIAKSDLAHQREHFKMLSVDVYDLIKIAGTTKTIYQVYCPMYQNNKGGIWLSEVNEVKNPYFGNKMLKCGTIQEQIN
ncbi:MAG: DUF3347 domain-containing protein [Flavobacteriaceae bacterium]|nr:DUF3347 domain-containing protein [Flavobacteriaceae bacterium]